MTTDTPTRGRRKVRALAYAYRLIDGLPDGWHGQRTCRPDVVFLAHTSHTGPCAAVNVMTGEAAIRHDVDGLSNLLAARGIDTEEVSP